MKYFISVFLSVNITQDRDQVTSIFILLFVLLWMMKSIHVITFVFKCRNIFLFYCRYFLPSFDLFIVTPLLKYTMVFKGTATMIVRISRAVISHSVKLIFPPRTHDIPPINKNPQTIRFYLFPSVYRSFFSSYGPSIEYYQQTLANLMPFRAALNEIKRRLFFAGSYFYSFFFPLFTFICICISLLSIRLPT